MFDWVLGADIYRLRKAISETSDRHEQRALASLAEQKERVLASRRHDASPVHEEELSQ
jgi:hypothetical protein